MKIEEFIYAFDEGSTYAEYDEQRNVYIYDNKYGMMASLEKCAYAWKITAGCYMSSSLLKLMADLAGTPVKER